MGRFSLKRLPSPGLVVGVVALIAALSGTAIALPGKNTVDSGDIKKGAVKTSDIARGTVQTLTGTKVNYRASQNSAAQQIYGDGTVRLTASCGAGGALTLNLHTLVDNAAVQSFGGGPDTVDPDFDKADTPVTISSADEERDLVYTNSSGSHVVALQYFALVAGPSVRRTPAPSAASPVGSSSASKTQLRCGGCEPAGRGRRCGTWFPDARFRASAALADAMSLSVRQVSGPFRAREITT